MIKLIVCVAKNNLIGDSEPVGNGLLWHTKEELQHFNEFTKSHTVLFGKKTAEVVPLNIIEKTRDVIVLDFDMNVDEIISQYKNSKDVLWICGGASIYKLFLEKECVEEMYISFLKPHVKVQEANKPVYFPIELTDDFDIIENVEKTDFNYIVLKKNLNNLINDKGVM